MARLRPVLSGAGAALLLGVALSGCAAGGTVNPSPSSTSSAPPSAAPSAAPPTVAPTPMRSPDASAAESVVPPPTTSTLPAEPPAATLDALAGGRSAAGSLGTYTWGGGGSDSPWVVGPPAGSVGVGAKLEPTFSGLVPVSWTAAWAKVQHGLASGPVGGTLGSGAVAVTAPSTGGDWSLRVTATFGPGSSATYFWRLTVTP